MPMKYVMLKLDSGELLPLLFPEFMQHSHVAQSVPATVVSAGRVYLEDGKIIACGASSSLDVVSRRSEEHTSELQSRQYLVCRLLLEKKKLLLLLLYQPPHVLRHFIF